MKKLSLAVIAFVLLLIPVATFAIDLGGDIAAGAAREAGFDPGTTETTFAETLGTVVKTALSLVGVIFLSLMVYAGYLWMTARGDESQVEKAQKMIRSAVIGLIITVAAHSITSFVVPRIVERTAGGRQQTPAAASNTRLCDWGRGSSTNITEQQCQQECRGQARNSVNCRFTAPNTCEWDSGSSVGAGTNTQDLCFTECARVGRGNITCRWGGQAITF